MRRVKETRIEKVREAGGRLARCGAGAILERKISDIRYQCETSGVTLSLTSDI
jgi:hypothetical protein